MTDNITQLHAYIRGRVQGVCFRASTQQQARAMGITGWVQNLADGSVELVACAGKEQLQELVGWLWQGPPLARVDSIEFDHNALTAETHRDFVIR